MATGSRALGPLSRRQAGSLAGNLCARFVAGAAEAAAPFCVEQVDTAAGV